MQNRLPVSKISSDNHWLMELAHLYTVHTWFLKQTSETVAHYFMYPEIICT